MDEFPAKELESLENKVGKVLMPIFAACKTTESIVAYMAVTNNVAELKEILEKEKKP